MIFVRVRTLSPREVEELRLSTTSATRHDFVVPGARDAVLERLVPGLAAALSVPLDALTRPTPESACVAGGSLMTETLVEAKVWPLPADAARSAVQLVAQSRDRISPTVAIFVLSFLGMAVGFYGSFLARLPPIVGGVVSCALPFALVLPYLAARRRAVERSSKLLFAAFHGLEASLTSTGAREA
jgi:hypothetical protein